MTARHIVPPGSRLLIARDGDFRVVVARHRAEARLQPLVAVTTAGGKRFVIEMSEDDFRRLAESVSRWAAADEQQVAEWYEALGKDDPAGASEDDQRTDP